MGLAVQFRLSAPSGFVIASITLPVIIGARIVVCVSRKPDIMFGLFHEGGIIHRADAIGEVLARLAVVIEAVECE